VQNVLNDRPTSEGTPQRQFFSIKFQAKRGQKQPQHRGKIHDIATKYNAALGINSKDIIGTVCAQKDAVHSPRLTDLCSIVVFGRRVLHGSTAFVVVRLQLGRQPLAAYCER